MHEHCHEKNPMEIFWISPMRSELNDFGDFILLNKIRHTDNNGSLEMFFFLIYDAHLLFYHENVHVWH